MSRRYPTAPSEMSVSEDVKFKLFSASVATGFKQEDWEIAAEAVDEWLRRHDPDTIPMPATSGYQWKSLFLPDGTFLRTVFGGKNHHCVVANDRIMYNGQTVSPSGFVNAVGGIRRNAWRSTWILLPDAPQWNLADTLRSRPRPPRPRKPVRAIEQVAASPPHTGRTPSPPFATEPMPAQADPITASDAGEPSVRSGSHEKARQTWPDNETLGRQQRIGATRAPPGCRRRADRRRSGDGTRMHGPPISA